MLKDPSKIKQDPNACTKKYFKALSTSVSFIPHINNGINDNKLTSRPTHTYNQFLEEIDMIVPIIILIEKKKKKGIYIIK